MRNAHSDDPILSSEEFIKNNAEDFCRLVIYCQLATKVPELYSKAIDKATKKKFEKQFPASLLIIDGVIDWIQEGRDIDFIKFNLTN
jgi:hypothetical protein